MTVRLVNCQVRGASSLQPRQAEVVIEGTVIKQVLAKSRSRALSYPSSGNVYDLEGAYVLLGLWDCHTHPGSLIDSLRVGSGENTPLRARMRTTACPSIRIRCVTLMWNSSGRIARPPSLG